MKGVAVSMMVTVPQSVRIAVLATWVVSGLLVLHEILTFESVDELADALIEDNRTARLSL